MSNLRKTISRSARVLLALGVFSLPAAAQKVEIFGGYQFTHLHSSFNANGWNASLTGNFKHVLGITADFGGAYDDGVKAHTYTVGPVLTARLPVVQPFVHALFGGMTITNGGSSTYFAMQIGGGLDFGLRKGIGLRLVQADWVSVHANGGWANKNTRFSAGIVIKF